MLYDLIIIGAGAGGVSAGIYAARKRMKTLVLTKDFSGQTGKTSEVENYPGIPNISGMELARKFEAHLKKLAWEKGSGFEIKEGEETTKITKEKEFFLVRTKSKKEFQSRTVIVATGRDPRPLEVPGEKEFIGRGVSYCSICDGPLFRDKAVAVVGGGNAGYGAALDLASYAKQIFIFEKSDEFRADEILREKAAKEKKIETRLNVDLKEIKGKGKVETIIYEDLKTNRVFEEPVDGVFVAIGSIPATGFLKGMVKFNSSDEVVVNPETYESSCPGLYAVGDLNKGRWKQIVIAAGEGAVAVLEAHNLLRKKS